jgi:hypothetical protein
VRNSIVMSSSRLHSARQLQRCIEKAGGTISTYLELFANGSNIGLRAAKNVPAFQCIASIPLHMCMAESLVAQSEESASLKLITTLLNTKQSISQRHEGVLHTGEENFSDSAATTDNIFLQYFSLLPNSEELSCFPSHWREDQWSNITNSTLHHIHKSKQQQIQQMYQEISQTQPDMAHNFSLLDFIWADDIIGSRSYGQKQAKALVPFLDLVNHAEAVNRQPLGTTGCMVVCAVLCRAVVICVVVICVEMRCMCCAVLWCVQMWCGVYCWVLLLAHSLIHSLTHSPTQSFIRSFMFCPELSCTYMHLSTLLLGERSWPER